MNYKKGSVIAAAVLAASTFNLMADNVILTTPPNFEVLSMSPNGRWACGAFIDAAGDIYGFRWNLEGGGIEVLGGKSCVAYDVANDGTVSGDFMDTALSPNGAPVDLPGYWCGGRWNHLQMPDGSITDGMGTGISPDGQYMTGSICVDGIYTSYIWHNGMLHKSLSTGAHNVAFAVSPDGNSAAGYNTRHNRTACYWNAEGDVVYFDDSGEYSEGPFNYARNFSPDGSKIVYWGGWDFHPDTSDLYLYSIYDVNTGERTKIKRDGLYSSLELFDISNNGIAVGTEDSRGYVVIDGNGMYIDDYLAMRGVDLSDYDGFYTGGDYYASQLPISKIVAVSEDENVYLVQYYDNQGASRSMAIKIDQDYTTVTPAELKATELQGISTVKLQWKRPVGVNAVRGYNIYRDGVKINGVMPVNVPYYYDKGVADGVHTYEVSAVSLAGKETKCDPVDVEVNATQLQAPYSLFSRQRGVNSAYLTWMQPFSDIAHKSFYDANTADVESFAVYTAEDVEVAVMFDKAEMAMYSGMQITEVSFYPMAEQEGWLINIYTRDANGGLVELYSQEIDIDLMYRELNTVKLDRPVDLPNGDLIVAVECGADGINPETFGVDYTSIVPGASDLLRRKWEPDFYSAYDSALESGVNLVCFSWGIDVGLSPTDKGANECTAFNVYNGDELVATTADTYVDVPNLADGTYTFNVEAVYADGRVSSSQSTTVTISGRYPKIEDVKVSNNGDNKVLVSWQNPVDEDKTDLSYSHATKASVGIVSNEQYDYSYMAAVKYPAKTLRSYEGYRVTSFRFYPMSEATYSMMLYEGDEMLASVIIDEYTVNKWNEVQLDRPVTIERGHSYMLIAECVSAQPGERVFGVDNEAPIEYVTDLYSFDGGDTWSSMTAESGTRGNWMIGMCVSRDGASVIENDGYDVVIDGKTVNNSPLSVNSYEHDFGAYDANRHRVRVDVHYPLLASTTQGLTTYFYLTPAGIGDASIADVQLKRGDNLLVAQGDNVEGISIYDAAGHMVANVTGDTVDISSLGTGIYIVKVQCAGAVVTRKIRII